MLALSLTVIGNSFSEVWDRRNVALIRLGLRSVMIKNGVSPNDVYAAFSQSDTDRSGILTFLEFKELMAQKLKLKLSGAEFLDVWRAMDVDMSGAITFAEFTALYFPELAVDLLEDETNASMCTANAVAASCSSAAAGAVAASAAVMA